MFVDDLRENCAGAEAVGMTAVLHRETEETIARLDELFGLSAQQRSPPRVITSSIGPGRRASITVSPSSPSLTQASPRPTLQ